MMNESIPLKKIIEGALFAAGEPLSIDNLIHLFEEGERPDKKEVRETLTVLSADYDDRAIELKELASGYQFQVRSDFSKWIQRLWEERPARYSRALLETLALIAYRQPITRAEIEEVRGVSVSSNMIRTLMDREWIHIVGHRDVPGKPGLYATTKQFLDYFGLKSLEGLPILEEMTDFDNLNEIDKKLNEELFPSSEEQKEKELSIEDQSEEESEIRDEEENEIEEGESREELIFDDEHLFVDELSAEDLFGDEIESEEEEAHQPGIHLTIVDEDVDEFEEEKD